MSAPVVHAIHENPDWFGPFADALDAEGVPYVEWLLTGGVLDLDEPPPAGVFWSRFSASSHTRGHGLSKDHTRSVLSWVEAAGRRTVNGRSVLELEVSKVAQLTALRAAGIDVPRTVAVVGSAGLVDAARRFDGPFVAKHNQGGKGLGVHRFDDADELADHVASTEFEEPVDGVTLLQEYVQPADGTITRVELVGGELVYAIRADTTAGGFQLCPADACAIGPDGRPIAPPGALRAPEPGEQIFSLREDVDGLPIDRYLAFLAAHRVEVAGVELIEAADGRLVTYDVNTNTNYNAAVEAVAPRSGPRQVARLLGALLAKEKA
ncbi:ATP-grasp domain-containing protein [Cellulomonas sp. P5_C5]